MQFANIDQQQHNISYQVNVEWRELQPQLHRYTDHYGLKLNTTPKWTEQQQAEYIQYRLKGGVVGKDIWFNCPNFQNSRKKTTKMVLVDGGQRLLAVQKFLSDDLLIFGGACFSDFTDKLHSNVEFIFHVNGLLNLVDVQEMRFLLNHHNTVNFTM